MINVKKDNISKWGIELSSHDSEIDKNIFSIFLGTYIKSIILPFSLIKPIIDYQVYKKDIDDNDMLDVMGIAYATNTYGITYLVTDRYIELKWNYANDMHKNINNHIGINKRIPILHTKDKDV